MLAQQPDPGLLGSWVNILVFILGGLFALLGIANQIKQLLAGPPSPGHDDRPVTHADVKKIEEEQKYMRDRIHTLSQDIHNIGLTQERQSLKMREMIDSALKPMQAKLDKVAVITTAIGVKIGIPSVIDGEELL